MGYTKITDIDVEDPATSTWANNIKDNIEHIADTRYLPLPMGAVLFPLSGIEPATMEQVESSAAGNKPNRLHFKFDSSTDQGVMWDTLLPRDYGVNPILNILFYCDSTGSSRVAVFDAQVSAISDGDSSINAEAFDSANSANLSVPDESYVEELGQITLTNFDSGAALDEICILLYRDADNGSDDAGSIYVRKAWISYEYST